MFKKIKKIVKILINWDDKKSKYIPFQKAPFIEIMAGTQLNGQNSFGKFTYIGFNCTITQATIGNYCSIANNVSIGIGEHKINRVSTSSLFYENAFDTLTEKECIIGNDVWIGTNAVIRRGITIGNGAIIGANAFVNKDVKDFEIVGGVPAKILRMRFNQNTIDLINESNWWDLDLNNAKERIKNLEKSGNFDYN